jgi:hypothetical protein
MVKKNKSVSGGFLSLCHINSAGLFSPVVAFYPNGLVHFQQLNMPDHTQGMEMFLYMLILGF